MSEIIPEPSDQPEHSRRGRPFEQGNPGRRPGSKNKATMIAMSLLEGEAQHLVRKAIDMAKAGDKDMLKFLLSRVLPKERSVPLNVHVENFTHALDAIATVTNAVSAGELTPSEGAAVGSLITSYTRMPEAAKHEMKRREGVEASKRFAESLSDTDIRICLAPEDADEVIAERNARRAAEEAKRNR